MIREKWRKKTDLLAHFDDNIRVTAHHIPDGKIDTFFNMNSQQTQQVLHGRKINVRNEMKQNGFSRQNKWLQGTCMSQDQSGCSYL